MIPRALMPIIEKEMYKGKVIVITGARQVGKTTLLQKLTERFEKQTLWLSGDEPDVREMLGNASSTLLTTLIGKHTLVVIDEAQRIKNIGLALKLIVDNLPDIQVIVTGSSALELAGEIQEPLTGRKTALMMYPLSLGELVAHTGRLEEFRLLEHRMIYGSYPEIITSPGREENVLRELSESYLYKDILALGGIRKPLLLQRLVQALALQVGNEVTSRELAQLTGVDAVTVDRYLDLLEKSFVIIRLSSLARNIRNEIKKGKKIYFIDNGILNAVIRNFNPLALRQDVGALWENYLISERAKYNLHQGKWVNRYFWRTHAQQEIDYVEEYGGKLHAYEFKWSYRKRVRFPSRFKEAYPDTETHVVTPETVGSFLL